MAKGLCDELGTVDDVLLEFIDKGYYVYEVAYDPVPVRVGRFLSNFSGTSSTDKPGVGGGWRGVFRSMVRGVVSDVKEEAVAELLSSMDDMNSAERQYIAKDDSADRIQMKE